MKKTIFPIIISLCLYSNASSFEEHKNKEKNDSHYVDSGFFDIHLCNWPNRELFILALFSTSYFENIEKIVFVAPDGMPIGEADLERYRHIKTKDGEEKRVFQAELNIPEKTPSGWYKAHVTLANGKEDIASDYVQLKKMPRPDGLNPPHLSEDVTMPGILRWNPVSSATHYKVLIRDLWADNALIVDSPAAPSTEFTVPDGVLTPGGWYEWRVHARDVNGDTLLGDFNHGSLSEWHEFSIEE